jgi:hypothetical protein
MRSAVQEEVYRLNAKQKRPALSRYAKAADDRDDILECYRRIETHFRQLQVSIWQTLRWRKDLKKSKVNVSMSTWCILNEQLVVCKFHEVC